MSTSFSYDIKHALAQVNSDSLCCARSELAAALRASGGISFRGCGRYALSVTASSGSVVRHYFRMIKQHWNISGEIRVLNTSSALSSGTRYRLVLEEEYGEFLLRECGLWDEEAPLSVRTVPREEILEKSCCRYAFLRSAFMMLGTADNPDHAYALEYDAPTEEYADCLYEILQYCELDAKKVCRKSKYVVYLKNSENICDVLTLMGAHAARLRIEEIRVQKDIMGNVNRRINCDGANIRRTTEAARKQLEDIEFLDETLGLRNLPSTLKELALLRQEHPEASLVDLGKELNPPVGKSGVNARIRRISALADQVRSGEYQRSKEK